MPSEDHQPDVAIGGGSAPGDPGTSGDPSRRPWPLRAAALLALVALVFLAVTAVLWWRADHDSSLEFAQTRDEVLIDAQREVGVLTTLDYNAVDSGLDRWLDVSTGDLNDQLSKVDADARQALTDAGKVSTGTVVAAALSELDVRAGTATGIATVEISVLDQAGDTTTKRDRFSIDLSRVDGRWLVARLDQVPVGVS